MSRAAWTPWKPSFSTLSRRCAWLAAIAAAGSALLGGCPEEPAAGESGGSGPAWHCAERAREGCRLLITCAPPGLDRAACEHAGTAGCPESGARVAAAVEAGTAVYDEEAALQCLAAFRSAGCDPEPQQEALAVCDDVVTGRVAEGGACRDDFECGDEAHCSDLDSCPGSCIVYSSGCGDGPECPLDQQCRHEVGGSSCVARAALGEACGDRSCLRGLECADDLVCRPLPVEGEACWYDCASGLRCFQPDPAAAGSCRAPGEEGDPCTTVLDCRFWLGCAGASGGAVGRCTEGIGLLGSCELEPADMYGDRQDPCAPGLACVAGSCRFRPGEGDPCEPAATRCLQGNRCDAATSTCVRALVHGEPCTADLECLFNSCEDGVCVGGC